LAICVDASVVVKLLVREAESEHAVALIRIARDRGDRLVAPSLMRYEVASSLWQKTRRGLLERDDAQTAFDRIAVYPIQFLISGELVHRAWRLAQRLALPSMYDAQYLAVAENQGCPLWTADRRLAEAAAAWPGEIRLLGRDATSDV